MAVQPEARPTAAQQARRVLMAERQAEPQVLMAAQRAVRQVALRAAQEPERQAERTVAQRAVRLQLTAVRQAVQLVPRAAQRAVRQARTVVLLAARPRLMAAQQVPVAKAGPVARRVLMARWAAQQARTTQAPKLLEPLHTLAAEGLLPPARDTPRNSTRAAR